MLQLDRCRPSSGRARARLLAPLVLSICLLGLLIAPSAGAALNYTRADVTTPPSPRAVAVGNFDANASPDLAVVNYAMGASVEVYFNDGSGGFSNAAANSDSYPTGTFSSDVEIGSFNAGTVPDLAVSNETGTSGGTVSVLLGVGDGTFGAATNYSAGFGPTEVADGDLDGDTDSDLVFSSFGTGSDINRTLNAGNGTFPGPVSSRTGGGNNGQSVELGNFTDTAALDGVVTNKNSDTVSVFPGNGAGGWAGLPFPTNYSVGDMPESVVSGNFNGDALPDLAVANGGSANVSILLADGSGGFGAATNFAAGSSPFDLAVGDINGDAHTDLAVANFGGGTVALLLGNGTGGFAAPVTVSLGGGFGSSVAIADLNADSRSDLVATNQGSNRVSVLINTPIGVLTPSPSSIDFGVQNVGTISAPQTVTLTNSGDAPFTVSSAQVTGTNADEFLISSNGCSAPVPVGDDCEIALRFAPGSATPAMRQASLQITSNAQGSPHSVPLSGTATVPSSGTPVTTQLTPTAPTFDLAAAIKKCKKKFDKGTKKRANCIRRARQEASSG